MVSIVDAVYTDIKKAFDKKKKKMNIQINKLDTIGVRDSILSCF